MQHSAALPEEWAGDVTDTLERAVAELARSDERLAKAYPAEPWGRQAKLLRAFEAEVRGLASDDPLVLGYVRESLELGLDPVEAMRDWRRLGGARLAEVLRDLLRNPEWATRASLREALDAVFSTTLLERGAQAQTG